MYIEENIMRNFTPLSNPNRQEPGNTGSAFVYTPPTSTSPLQRSIPNYQLPNTASLAQRPAFAPSVSPLQKGPNTFAQQQYLPAVDAGDYSNIADTNLAKQLNGSDFGFRSPDLVGGTGGNTPDYTGASDFVDTEEDGTGGSTFGGLQAGARVLQGVGALAQGYASIKQLGLARDSFNFQKDFANKQYDASRTTVNNRINDQNVYKTAQGRTDLANLVV